MKILISGAGIAGPTLAYWLHRYGFIPTVVEKAPHLRTGGYLIDFWGLGFDIAERMGLLPEILRKGYKVQEVRTVNREGKHVAGFSTKVFERLTNDRFISLPRGELASSIFNATEGKVEAIFGDSIAQIEQSRTAVQVTFESGRTREFDLVIGADGLHSKVRELVHGPQSKFEKYLGYKVAAFEVQGYRPRDELAYVMYTQVHQQVARFSMRNDRTLFLLIYADENFGGTDKIESQKAALRNRFADSGWECPRIREELDASSELYFDRVSQIRMGGQGSWTQGRVTLIGDAASCVSLLAGQGSALAMIAAYILAGELHRTQGDYVRAFARYEELFGSFVLRKQKAAPQFAGFFAPKSALRLFLRNRAMNFLRIPWVSDVLLRGDLLDHIALPEYEPQHMPTR